MVRAGRLEEVWSAILAVLKPPGSHPDIFELFEALQSLGSSAAPSLPLLAECLNWVEEALVWECTRTIRAVGSIEAYAVLAEALKNQRPCVRKKAADMLANWKEKKDGSSLLLRDAFWRESDPSVRAAIAEKLARANIAAPAKIELTAALDDSDFLVRIQAAAALGTIEPGNSKVLEILLRALQHSDGAVRREAVFGLSLFVGPSQGEVLPTLLTAFGDADEKVAEWAARAVGRVGIAAAPALLDMLRNSAALRLHYYAISALEKIVPPIREAMPLLVEILQQRNTYYKVGHPAEGEGERDTAILVVPGAAACMLAMLVGPTDQGAVPALVGVLDGAGHEVTLDVVKGLGKIGRAAGEALPTLHNLANEEEGEIRDAALDSIAKISQS
jgi:HEAT repeat protein